MTGARARSPDAKWARRQSILTTAEQILRSDGFDAFTMNSLATTTGLAKGTLYLYFSSREELVLALYIHLNDDWVDRFLHAERHIYRPIMRLYAPAFTSLLPPMRCLLILLGGPLLAWNPMFRRQPR